MTLLKKYIHITGIGNITPAFSCDKKASFPVSHFFPIMLHDDHFLLQRLPQTFRQVLRRSQLLYSLNSVSPIFPYRILIGVINIIDLITLIYLIFIPDIFQHLQCFCNFFAVLHAKCNDQRIDDTERCYQRIHDRSISLSAIRLQEEYRFIGECTLSVNVITFALRLFANSIAFKVRME